jgi:outer membrane receptor protein involved in Fe transport
MKTSTLHDAIAIAMLGVAAGMAGSATAMERPPVAVPQAAAGKVASQASFDFDIPAGDLGAALNYLSSQSGLELLYPADALAGKQSPALRGRMAWEEALATLLRGSGFGYRRAADGSVVVEGAAAPASPGATTLGTVVVTGTRISGGTSASPVITVDSEDLKEQGFADIGEVVRSIPQNFGGGQNPGVAGGASSGAAGIANQNITGGSALNLRGLGPDATLTLLNGRRMSYDGFFQAVDISAIPVEAVERIDILPDGASAVYGSDAVGGVGNVILQRDYDGVAVGARYGDASGGGLLTHEYTGTAGTTWRTGGFIATYKHTSTDPLLARERDYTHAMADPTSLYPASELRSALLSAHQSLGDHVELNLDALRTERDDVQYAFNLPAQPYYNILTGHSVATLVAPGVDVTLPGEWTLRVGAGRSRNTLASAQTRISRTGAAPRPLSDDCYCNELSFWDAGAEGPLFALRGGQARLAVGTGYRRNTFALDQGLTGVVAAGGEESSRSGYAELNLPFVGPDNGIAGMRRLEVNLAARTERYDSFGDVTTPKLGVIYGPGPDFTLKASWGRSFKAPTLFQRFWLQQGLLWPAQAQGGSTFGADQTVLMLGGGNPDLEPERATTRSASLVLHPQALPALDAELDWYDIDYTDRVVQPIGNPVLPLLNPAYESFIDRTPSAEEQQAVLDHSAVFYNLTGAPYDPSKVVAIVYANYANAARQRIRGLDLSASYRFEFGASRLVLRGAASWLHSAQQATPQDTFADLAGVLYGPARFKARLGAVWSRGGLSLSGFANHVDGVTGPLVGGGMGKSASFNTVDATLRYETEAEQGPWSGLALALSAQNLFDRTPPLFVPVSPSYTPYDSTNYSAIGRFVSLSVTKRF